LIDLSPIVLSHEPFPNGSGAPAMDESVYARFSEYWPTEKVFQTMGQAYRKLSLSEKFNPDMYRSFIASSPYWTALHGYIKSTEFQAEALAKFGLPPQNTTARFEFSSMPADGGFIRPHRDIATKLLTLVIPIVRPGEWSPEWGGATEILIPKDSSADLVDYQADFTEFRSAAHQHKFLPNHVTAFMKTANSWHAVRQMTGPSGVFRRSLTVNVEAVQ
jgi:hypothetical protein